MSCKNLVHDKGGNAYSTSSSKIKRFDVKVMHLLINNREKAGFTLCDLVACVILAFLYTVRNMLGGGCSNQSMPITEKKCMLLNQRNRFIQKRKKRLNQFQFKTPKQNPHLLIPIPETKAKTISIKTQHKCCVV
jgi:hypothetical protein